MATVSRRLPQEIVGIILSFYFAFRKYDFPPNYANVMASCWDFYLFLHPLHPPIKWTPSSLDCFLEDSRIVRSFSLSRNNLAQLKAFANISSLSLTFPVLTHHPVIRDALSNLHLQSLRVAQLDFFDFTGTDPVRFPLLHTFALILPVRSSFLHDVLPHSSSVDTPLYLPRHLSYLALSPPLVTVPSLR